MPLNSKKEKKDLEGSSKSFRDYVEEWEEDMKKTEDLEGSSKSFRDEMEEWEEDMKKTEDYAEMNDGNQTYDSEKRSIRLRRNKLMDGSYNYNSYYNKEEEDYPPYLPNNDFTLYDYIKECGKMKVYTGDSKDECLARISADTLPMLSLVIRKVTMGQMVFVAKESMEKPYAMYTIIDKYGFLKGSTDGKIKYTYTSEPKTGPDKGKKIECSGSVGPFTLFLSSNKLISRKVVCEPYHLDLVHPSKLNCSKLNIFKGFKAKFRKDLSIDDCEKICKPLLDHLYESVCNGDESTYKRFLEHIFYPIRELVKSEVMVSIIGPQGLGKTILFDFLEKYVFGENLLHQVAGLDAITGKFNSLIEGKLFICINETHQAGSAKGISLKQTEILKEIITGSNVNIEPKTKDIIKVKNCSSLFLTSNNDQPIIVAKDDRRNFIIKTSTVVKPLSFYKNLAKIIMTQEFGDAFYTLARKSPSFCDIKDVPFNEAKMEVIKASRPRAFDFFSSIFEESTTQIPRTDLHVSDNQIYWAVKDAYILYTRWHKETNNGELWNAIRFSKVLKSYNGLEHIDRKRLNGRPQMAYVIILKELYPTTFYIDLDTNRDHCISKLVKNDDSEVEVDEEDEEEAALMEKLRKHREEKAKNKIKK